MKPENLQNAMQYLRDDYLEHAEEYKEKKTRRKWMIPAAAALAIALGVTAYAADWLPLSGSKSGKPSPNIHIEVDWAETTLEECIDKAPVILYGSCEKVDYRRNGGVELVLNVQSCLRGDCSGSVTLRAMMGASFAPGQEYLIFAQKEASVFDESEFYAVNQYISDYHRGTYEGCISSEEKLSVKSALKYTKKYVKKHPYTGDDVIIGDYCRSENLQEIFDWSSCVLSAKITGIFYDFAEDRTTYTIEPLMQLKGTVPENCHVVAKKNSMQPGEVYWLMLSKPDEHSLILTISSPYSVLVPGSEAAAFLEEMQ